MRLIILHAHTRREAYCRSFPQPPGHVMDAIAAHDIIEKLALGIDPVTGTPLDESVFHSPTVIRALFMAKDALATAGAPGGQGAQGAARARPKLANAGKKWESADKETLRELHLAGATSRQIAVQLGRSNGAIISQLIKDGLIEESDAGLSARVHRDAVIDRQPA
jgi:hypothetical protein